MQRLSSTHGGHALIPQQLGAFPPMSLSRTRLSPALVNAGLVDELEVMFGSVKSFPFHFRTVRWFGDRVVWLAPEPDGPFRQMTALVTRRWPDYQPCGGRYADAIPHLTIAEGGQPDEMKRAARQVAGALPVAAVAREVWLMSGSTAPGSWSVLAVFPLARLSR